MKTILSLWMALAVASAADALPEGVALRAGLAFPAGEAKDIGGRAGAAIGVGWRSWQRGVVGRMGVDGDAVIAHGGNGQIDSLAVCYMERVAMSGPVYLGGGAGVLGLRALDRRNDDAVLVRGVRPAAKALVGYRLPALDGVRWSAEAAYTLASGINGITPSMATITLVGWF